MALLDRFRRNTDPTHETRAPQVATSVRSSGVGLTTLSGLDDEQITRRVWLANTYVDACIRAVADDLARLKFRVGPDPDKPQDYRTNTPLAWLLGPAPGSPNPVTTPRRLWKWTIAQRMALGRWAWELELDEKRRVTHLWPLVTRRLAPVPDETGAGQWWAKFEYTPENGGVVDLFPDQVAYDWCPHPDNFRHWISPLQAARLDVDVLVSQDRYDSAFIRNDARPSTIIAHQEFADVAERDTWRENFENRHGGPDGAGRVAWVEAPMGENMNVKDALAVVQVGVSQREAQSLERYAAKLRGVCVALGVPMGRLLDVSGRTFSNADREIRTYWNTTVWNLAEELADAVNLQVAPRVGDGSMVGWFDRDGVEELRPTPLLALPTVIEAVAGNLIGGEEGRELIGFSGPPPEPAAVEPVEPAATTDDADPADDDGRARRAATRATINGQAPTGAMIALAPADPDALTVDGGDPADALHVTLKYLGKAAAWDADQRAAVDTIAADWAARHGPFTATVGGIGRLGTEGAVVLHLDVPGLADARAALDTEILDLDPPDGVPGLADTYDQFIPHLTIGYDLDVDDLEDMIGTTIRFNTCRVHWADTTVDLNLGAARNRPTPQIRARRSATWMPTMDAHVAVLEQGWQSTIATHFADQRGAVLGRLNGNRGITAHRRGELRTSAAAVFDPDYWTRKLNDIADGLYSQTVTLAGAHLAGVLDISFDLEAPHIDAFIRNRANQLAGQVTDTTYRAIQDQLAAGVAAGESIEQLAARIEHLFDVTWAGRAEMVAQTEVISAYNGGTVTTALGYGPDVVAALEWIATNDNRTRDAHRAASGQMAEIGDAFFVGGERLAYPGDPSGSPSNTVRCRCAVAPVTPDEFTRAGGRRRVRSVGSVELREVERLVVAAAVGDIDWHDVIDGMARS